MELVSEQQLNMLLGKVGDLRKNIRKVIVGQDQVIDLLLVGLFASGHVLLEGVPGLAKTLMIRTLAETIEATFSRIQFTPDLMPSDILGTEILQSNENGSKFFKYIKGPVFSNIVLADEINRTPPKTQSALLELMQEYAVTYAGQKYPLPRPFFLLATQNPIEQSGTFPLPEAQVDRFLLYIKIDYPSAIEEEQILLETTGAKTSKVEKVFSGEEIIALQELCRQVHIDPSLVSLVSKWVRTTRPQDSTNALVKEYIDWGAGPRAGQAIILAAKGYALLKNRFAVSKEDLKVVFMPAIQHRLIMNFKANIEKVKVQDILTSILQDG